MKLSIAVTIRKAKDKKDINFLGHLKQCFFFRHTTQSSDPPSYCTHVWETWRVHSQKCFTDAHLHRVYTEACLCHYACRWGGIGNSIYYRDTDYGPWDVVSNVGWSSWGYLILPLLNFFVNDIFALSTHTTLSLYSTPSGPNPIPPQPLTIW